MNFTDVVAKRTGVVVYRAHNPPIIGPTDSNYVIEPRGDVPLTNVHVSVLQQQMYMRQCGKYPQMAELYAVEPSHRGVLFDTKTAVRATMDMPAFTLVDWYIGDIGPDDPKNVHGEKYLYEYERNGVKVLIDSHDYGNACCEMCDYRVFAESEGIPVLVGLVDVTCAFLNVCHRGYLYVAIITLVDVKRGEELTIDYGDKYWLTQGAVMRTDTRLIIRFSDKRTNNTTLRRVAFELSERLVSNLDTQHVYQYKKLAANPLKLPAFATPHDVCPLLIHDIDKHNLAASYWTVVCDDVIDWNAYRRLNDFHIIITLQKDPTVTVRLDTKTAHWTLSGTMHTLSLSHDIFQTYGWHVDNVFFVSDMTPLPLNWAPALLLPQCRTSDAKKISITSPKAKTKKLTKVAKADVITGNKRKAVETATTLADKICELSQQKAALEIRCQTMMAERDAAVRATDVAVKQLADAVDSKTSHNTCTVCTSTIEYICAHNNSFRMHDFDDLNRSLLHSVPPECIEYVRNKFVFYKPDNYDNMALTVHKVISRCTHDRRASHEFIM